jgi:hypothetical protein
MTNKPNTTYEYSDWQDLDFSFTNDEQYDIQYIIHNYPYREWHDIDMQIIEVQTLSKKLEDL